jgi:glucose-1-phosphate adenylyltransferase
VVLPEVDIGRGCTIRRAILDRGCQISANTEIGVDQEQDRARGFRVTDRGIVLVTAAMLGQQLHSTR